MNIPDRKNINNDTQEQNNKEPPQRNRRERPTNNNTIKEKSPTPRGFNHPLILIITWALIILATITNKNFRNEHYDTPNQIKKTSVYKHFKDKMHNINQDRLNEENNNIK